MTPLAVARKRAPIPPSGTAERTSLALPAPSPAAAPAVMPPRPVVTPTLPLPGDRPRRETPARAVAAASPGDRAPVRGRGHAAAVDPLLTHPAL
ncbi:hypothetical protein EV189_0365 [Motilibacter rhizosphaerae]|uniref:Uncharacterized protein n=1 Tax=Motilibacter rhizosphaerae TaxID=598652 RepID=A0A4Q7NXK6_9ACTN|nr:hypothetical protein EV189_0365 [Motilibacter rhizosphaerae]